MTPTLVGIVDRAESGDSVRRIAKTPGALETQQQEHGTRKQVTLSIQNMTCAACPRNVRKALSAIEGVRVLSVTSSPAVAVVEYNPSAVTIEELTDATTNIGYPSAVL